MFINHFTIEDFSKPLKSQFINTRKESNILNYLCQDLSPKLEITKHVVNCIKKRNKSSFPTSSHLQWAMECVGFSFSLPIEHHQTISSAIDIYKNWLQLSTDDFPDCLTVHEAYYQQEIISHFSLLFTERGGDLHKHAELCKEVLLIFQLLSRNKVLTASTWEHFLSIFLQICVEVMGKNSTLTSEITPLLFKVLFEIWLRSNTRQVALWDQLSENFQYWIKSIWIVHHWATVQLALTKSVIELVFGFEKKKVKAIFRPLPKPFEQDLEVVLIETRQEQNVYFWYRLWRTMEGNTLGLFPDKSEICVELVKAVASLTDEMLYFAKSRNSGFKIEFEYLMQEHENLNTLLNCFHNIHCSFIDKVCRVPIPRIESILDIFGNWLFEYAMCEAKHCVRARGKAVGAISRIFSSDLGPVSKENAGKLYQLILKLIRSEVSNSVIDKFLKHSAFLFTCNMPGIRLLCDKDNILKLLLTQLTDKKTKETTRKYCYNILSTCCMNFNYETKFESIKITQEILLEGIMNENDPANFHKVVWITCSFFLIVYSNTDILQSLILALVNRLKNIIDDRMYSNLILVISTIPFLVSKSSMAHNSFATKIIYKICGYVRKRLYCHSDILSNLLFALQKWIRTYQFVLMDLGLRTELLDVLACSKLSEMAGELSEYIEDLILCSVGKESVKIDIQGSSGAEVPFGTLEKPSGSWHHFLLYSSVLLSISGNQDELLLILRNRIGKSIYKIQPKYILPTPQLRLNFSIDTYSFASSYYQPESIDLDFELSDSESSQQRLINSHLYSQMFSHYKGSYLTSRQLISTQEVKNFPLSPQLILSQLGLFDVDSLEHVLESDPDSVLQIITDLDRFGSKEIYFLPVLFLSTSTSLDFLSSLDSFSSGFWDFLNQLGVKLGSEHMGLGYLSHVSMYLDRFNTILYSSDSSHEVISIVPCLSDEDLTLKEIVGSSPVIVLWNSRQDDSFCNFQLNVLKFPEFEHKDCLIITPIKENMVRVNFHPNSDLPGPLIDNMVLPLYMVGKMVIYTVVNLYGNSHEAIQTRKNRKFLLEQLEVLEKGKSGLDRVNFGSRGVGNL